MTSSLRRKSSVRRAFTLVELLIVMGIIVALATILLPMAGKAYKQAVRSRMAADLAVISNALEAYRQDFGDYPRMGATTATSAKSGAALLCWALVAPGPATTNGNNPGDGADGPGFRLRGTTGAVKGPYLPADRFNIGVMAAGMSEVGIVTQTPPPSGKTINPDDSLDVLADRYYHPILYFPANKGANPSAKNVSGGAFVNESYSPQALFNYQDNSPTGAVPPEATLAIATLPNRLTVNVMRFRLGDVGDGSSAVPDGNLQPNETPAALGPYLLWAAGPDAYFGTDDDVVDNGSAVNLNVTPLPSTVFQAPTAK